MRYGLGELRRKPVLSVQNGCHLGVVFDLEFDTDTAQVTALLVRGKPRLCGLFGRQEDLEIPWEKIEVLGEDAVLVNWEAAGQKPHQKNRLSWFFSDE